MSVVLITGSNTGFGLAIATAFAERGDTVVAAMRNPERAGALVSAVRQIGGKDPDVVTLDVTDTGQRSHAVAAAIERHGGVDVLVNNAGILDVASIEDTTTEKFERVMRTNVWGPIELTKLVLPSMRARGRGRVVNVTAIGAVLCTPFLGAYVASKHAMDALTAALDLEVRPFGIRAVAVLPGSFRTGIAGAASAGTDSDAYAAAADRFRAGFTSRIDDGPTDLSPVADAVIRAATDPNPPQRQVVAGPIGEQLAPIVAGLDALHLAEAARVGAIPSTEA